MRVADAQAVVPDLCLAAADPAGDRALLDRLADWCSSYTPWAAADDWMESAEGGGLWLDITGCAHLMGSEPALVADLTARLARLGFTARAAVADTPGAAWAWARFGAGDAPCLPPGGQDRALASLPVTALRLSPAVAAGLIRLGVKWIGQLDRLARPALTARFGRAVGQRLDQALGRQDEPISPRRPPVAHRVDHAFAEPIARPEDIAAATRGLLDRLMAVLARQRLGVRRLELAIFRLDATVQRLAIGTSQPCRDAAHLLRLLGEPLGRLDAGFGIETLRLAAVETAPLEAVQASLVAARAGGDGVEDMTHLLDALGNRLGFDRIHRFAARPSHLPERAVQRAGLAPPLPQADEGFVRARRPLRLLGRPEPVQAVAPVPDAPPLLFRWRRRTHRIRRAEGPERLAAEWWRAERADRDYYCVEDEAGRRFWLFRQGLWGEGEPPRWFLHGIFP